MFSAISSLIWSSVVFAWIGIVVMAVRGLLAPLAKSADIILVIATALDTDLLTTPGTLDASAWAMTTSLVTAAVAPALKLSSGLASPRWYLLSLSIRDSVQVLKLAASCYAGIGPER